MARPHRLGLTPLQIAFIETFDGDAKSTAAKLAMSPVQASHWQSQDWFVEGLQRRTEREAKMARGERVADLAARILDRAELQAFWSDVVVNDEQTMRDRLAASKHLADSIGMFTQKVEITGDEAKPVCVKQVDLEERIKALATSGVKVVLDFLE